MGIIPNDSDYIKIKDAVRSLEKRKSNIGNFILPSLTPSAKPLTPESAFRLGSYSPDSPEVLQTPDKHSEKQKSKKKAELPPITPKKLFSGKAPKKLFSGRAPPRPVTDPCG